MPLARLTMSILPSTVDKLAMEAPEKAKKKNRDKKEIEQEKVKISHIIVLGLIHTVPFSAKQGAYKSSKGDCCLEE